MAQYTEEPNILPFDEEFKWVSYTHPFNAALNPVFGAIQIFHFPDIVTIKEGSNIIFSNGSSTETPVTATGGGKTLTQWYSKTAIDEIKAQLAEMDSEAKKLLLKDNNNPFILYSKCKYGYGKVENSFKKEIILPDSELHGFYLYRTNSFSVYKYNAGNDVVEDLGKTIFDNARPLSGEEYLLVSDPNFNTWNAKFKNVMKYNILNDGKDPVSVLEKYISNDFDDTPFEFKVLTENLPLVATKTTIDNKTTYSNVVNFSYDENWTFSFEDDSPGFEDHDLKHDVLKPIVINNKKVLPVKFSYIDSFYNENNEKFYDPTAFVVIKATATKKLSNNPDVSMVQTCYVYIKSSNDDVEDGDVVDITINYKSGGSKIINSYPSSLIELPSTDLKGSGIIAYTDDNTPPNNYRFRYKTPSTAKELTALSWNDLLTRNDTELSFKSEAVNVSGLPILFENQKYYFSPNNTIMYYTKENEKSGGNSSWNSVLSSDNANFGKITLTLDSKTYNVSKIGELHEGKIKLVEFYFKNNTTWLKIHSFGHYSTKFEEIADINTGVESFLFPYCDGFISEFNENLIKFVVYKTKNNKILNKDEFYYDENFYNSSIGSIWILNIDLLNKTTSLSSVSTFNVENSGTESNSATVYLPSNFNTEASGFLFHSKNIDTENENNTVLNKDYVYELFNNNFIGKTLKSDNSSNFKNESVFLIPCIKTIFTWNKKERKVSSKTDAKKYTRLFIVENSNAKTVFEKESYDNPYSLLKYDDKTVIFSSDKNVYTYNSATGLITDFTTTVSTNRDLFIIDLFDYEEAGEFHKAIAYNEGTKLFIGIISEKDGVVSISSKEPDGGKTFSSISPIRFGKHIHLPGVQYPRAEGDIDTDCCLLIQSGEPVDIKIASLSTNGSVTNKSWESNVNKNVIDCEMINGVLLVSRKDIDNNNIEVINMGGIHPSF